MAHVIRIICGWCQTELPGRGPADVARDLSSLHGEGPQRGRGGPVTTAQILESALATLRRDGWCQGSLHKDGRHCVIGGMHDGVVDARMRRALLSLAELAQRQIDIDDAIVVCERLTGLRLVLWNDYPGRTFADVEALLTAAITIARDEEASHGDRRQGATEACERDGAQGTEDPVESDQGLRGIREAEGAEARRAMSLAAL